MGHQMPCRVDQMRDTERYLAILASHTAWILKCIQMKIKQNLLGQQIFSSGIQSANLGSWPSLE